MTSGDHDRVTEMYGRWFNQSWGKNRWGVAIYKLTNIFIQTQPGRLETRRNPNMFILGIRQMRAWRDGIFGAKTVVSFATSHGTRNQTERVNSDVAFQFSWGYAMGCIVTSLAYHKCFCTMVSVPYYLDEWNQIVAPHPMMRPQHRLRRLKNYALIMTRRIDHKINKLYPTSYVLRWYASTLRIHKSLPLLP